MKGYVAVFLVTALLLLLLPLPALPHRDATASAPDTTTTTTTTTTTANPTQIAPPTTEEATFRLLCGTQVVTLSEREFLIRSLAREMSPTYHEEALKAQAVATYTYYSRRRHAQQTEPDPALLGADFATPDEAFPAAYAVEKLQVNWGDNYTAYYDKLCRAVDGVLGRAMTREGQLIDACYFAISNGCTESAQTVWGADVPYLQAVASPGDRLATGYESTATFTPEQIKTALGESVTGWPEDPTTWFGQPTLSAAGTVASIPVGNASLAGTEVRRLLGLRSATFSVAYADGQFTFTVHGYGHGVGMSQYGADHLARQGYSWEQILHHYYTDVTIVSLF